MAGDQGLTLGVMRPTDSAKVLEKAAAMLGVPVPPSDEAIGFMVGPFRLRRVDPMHTEVMRDGEGGHFSTAELSEVIGRFVSERL